MVASIDLNWAQGYVLVELSDVPAPQEPDSESQSNPPEPASTPVVINTEAPSKANDQAQPTPEEQPPPANHVVQSHAVKSPSVKRKQPQSVSATKRRPRLPKDSHVHQAKSSLGPPTESSFTDSYPVITESSFTWPPQPTESSFTWPTAATFTWPTAPTESSFTWPPGRSDFAYFS